MAEADPAMTNPGAGKGALKPLAPIIVKKITIVEGGHHGGAWKVAYADFVTAMMAFFLLLWLLGATEEKQRKGIADYFTPTLVKMREQSAGSDGLLKGSSLTDVDDYPHAMGQTGTRSITIPRAADGGPKEAAGQADSSPDKAAEKVRQLREKIARKLADKRELRKLARQVRVMRSPDGIRIDLMDDADFAMFELGTTILTGPARALIATIGDVVAAERAPLILRGHTDSLPWRKEGVVANNWSLSAGRAEATRQALLLAGIAPSRMARIEGVADTEPLIGDNPADPRNRRISLLLLERAGRSGDAEPPRETAREAPAKAAPAKPAAR